MDINDKVTISSIDAEDAFRGVETGMTGVVTGFEEIYGEELVKVYINEIQKEHLFHEKQLKHRKSPEEKAIEKLLRKVSDLEKVISEQNKAINELSKQLKDLSKATKGK